MSYSIILPAYKEAKNLSIIIDQIQNFMKGKIFEIIVVDDFSDDGTERILKKKQKKYKNLFFYLRKLKYKSLAGSILKGISLSKKNNIIVMDSDFNHKPKDLKRLISRFENKKLDFVIGSRFERVDFKKLKFRFILSYYFCIFLSILLGIKSSDSLSGFFILKKKILKRSFEKKIFYGYGDFFFRLIYLIEKKKYKYENVQIMYGERIYGISKSTFFGLLFKYTFQAIKLKIFGISIR
tara:strand:- start:462 stop:1175 length:714 start_codon:yes stop_codon:yes gene_type:complete